MLRISRHALLILLLGILLLPQLAAAAPRLSFFSCSLIFSFIVCLPSLSFSSEYLTARSHCVYYEIDDRYDCPDFQYFK